MTEEAPAPAHEMEIAESIRDGALASPQHLPNFSLFEMRITGTGAAYRMQGKEHTWRDPAVFCSPEFVARCNGLPVVFEHPERTDDNPSGMVTPEEFQDRIVGMIILPYVKEQETWGVARVYDKATIALMMNGKISSTSPGVVFAARNDNREVDFDTSTKVLIEGSPQILDHLAICEVGVWDKLGEPEGITITGEDTMADENTKAAEERKEEKEEARSDAAPKWFSDAMSGMADRLDALEKRDTKRDSEDGEKEEEKSEKKAEEEKSKDDAGKRDAEDEDKKEREKADAAKRDAEETSKAAKRIDAIEARMKQDSDEDAADKADAQAKCDAVAPMFGKQARAPMVGESSINYRRRLVTEYQAHSPAWKDTDLSKVGHDVLRIAEGAIYADAQKAVKSALSVTAGTGQLREVRKQRYGGGFLTEFYGDPDSWMSHFKPATRHAITGFGNVQKGA